jgi:hypothetical protein
MLRNADRFVLQKPGITAEPGELSQTAAAKNNGCRMSIEQHGVTLMAVLQWGWLLLFGAMGWILRKISVHSVANELLAQAVTHLTLTRDEDIDRHRRERDQDQAQHRAERREIIETINKHHSTIVARLDRFSE